LFKVPTRGGNFGSLENGVSSAEIYVRAPVSRTESGVKVQREICTEFGTKQ